MHPSSDFLSAPSLDHEGWRDLVRTICGWYSPNDIGLETFYGKVRARNICGFVAVDLSCNALRVERTLRDVRLDNMEHYYIIFQTAGQSTVVQNDQTMDLQVGDVALIDAARPVTYFSRHRDGHWLSLQLPRRSLVAHLGLEPRCGFCRRDGTIGTRLLGQLVVNEDAEAMSAQASGYLHLAFYDLLGSLFAPASAVGSLHADKLFMRICHIIRNRYLDPDIGPNEVAAEAGISLRYLQKLFTHRGTTCSLFIQSLRLEQAARLAHRRTTLKTTQPLSEIAYVCGFSDYTHFARAFRRRFGHSPGATGVMTAGIPGSSGSSGTDRGRR
jgi:AraC family transcriptional activator of tynA and feaB